MLFPPQTPQRSRILLDPTIPSHPVQGAVHLQALFPPQTPQRSKIFPDLKTIFEKRRKKQLV